VYCWYRVPESRRPYRWLALWPVAFGTQQLFEGMVWQGLATGDAWQVRFAALGFLFFSHLFWPAGVAVTAWRLGGPYRQWQQRLAVLGMALGLALYLPIVADVNPLTVEVVYGSVSYTTALARQALWLQFLASGLYALVVLAPLWLSDDPLLRRLALLIGVSFAAAGWSYNYAFISIWCFFAAILSVYIARIVRELPVAREAVA
jgi:hypothetical protein